MRYARYNLIYSENTDSSDGRPKVRSFIDREAAWAAMQDSFVKMDAILHFPPSDPDLPGYVEDEFATILSDNSITVKMGLDTYRWEIAEIIPEDITKAFVPGKKDFSFWGYYEYKARPLAFLSFAAFNESLTDKQVLDLVQLFDGLYGDTDQETTDWALEFQLLTRMLIHHRALLVNPKYLDIRDCLDEVKRLLSPAQYKFFEGALCISQEELNQMAPKYD